MCSNGMHRPKTMFSLYLVFIFVRKIFFFNIFQDMFEFSCPKIFFHRSWVSMQENSIRLNVRRKIFAS